MHMTGRGSCKDFCRIEICKPFENHGSQASTSYKCRQDRNAVCEDCSKFYSGKYSRICIWKPYMPDDLELGQIRSPLRMSISVGSTLKSPI